LKHCDTTSDLIWNTVKSWEITRRVTHGDFG